MTTRMTSTHCTSTIAWRVTTLTSTSTECTDARIVSPSLIIHTHIWLKFKPCPHLSPVITHGHPCERCSFLTSILLHFLLPSLPPVCLPLSLLPPQRRPTPKLNKKIMKNLCDCGTNGGEGTYDVLYLPTGYEPKAP